ncbi:MAG: cytochrome-c peroxidase [Gemmatimonadaceae bacterium]
MAREPMMRVLRRTVCVTLVLTMNACRDTSLGPDIPPTPTLDAEIRQQLARWGVMPILPMPSQDRAMVSLGQALMFDKILSGNRDVSCGTCHDPALQGGDGLSLAVGTGGSGTGTNRTPGTGRQFVARNATSLLNVGLGPTYLFWDARLSQHGNFPGGPSPAIPRPSGVTDALVAQAFFPVASREEMRGRAGDHDRFGNTNDLAQIPDDQPEEVWRAVMRRVLAIPEYVRQFRDAFPSIPVQSLAFEHAATAIVAFEKEAYTRTSSPFDRYLARDDNALSPAAKRGARLFLGKGMCASCHSGALLGSQSFSNAGVPQLGPGTGTGAPLDFGVGDTFDQALYRFAFRVPALRNVALTAPYMHNGAYSTLDAVVRHYNNVPKSLAEYDVSQLAPALRVSYHGDQQTIDAVLATLDTRLRQPLNLTDDEISDLVAFLESLTDPSARDLGALMPTSVPSGLPVR